MKIWRFKYGLTQEQASIKLHCDKSYWNEIENGKKEPSLRMASKIVKLCGGDVTYENLVIHQ